MKPTQPGFEDLIDTNYFRRAGDVEGFVDPVTGQPGFRSATLGIDVVGATAEDAERKLHDALRAHPDPVGHMNRAALG